MSLLGRFKVKRWFTTGQLIPWGFSWYVDYETANRYFVVNIRIPFVTRERCLYTAQDAWGSYVIRWAIGYRFSVIWVPFPYGTAEWMHE